MSGLKRPGATVRLNSGGPLMVINSTFTRRGDGEPMAWCHSEEDIEHLHRFPLAALTLVPEPER